LFSAHNVNIWNSLPNSVVNDSTINTLKSHLDKFWSHQEVKFAFKSDLTGTVNCSSEVTRTQLSQRKGVMSFVRLFITCSTVMVNSAYN